MILAKSFTLGFMKTCPNSLESLTCRSFNKHQTLLVFIYLFIYFSLMSLGSIRTSSRNWVQHTLTLSFSICFIFPVHIHFTHFKYIDAIYLTSHRIRIWHKAVLWRRLRTNLDSCVAGAKILDPDGIPLLLHL